MKSLTKYPFRTCRQMNGQYLTSHIQQADSKGPVNNRRLALLETIFPKQA
jgi:hypothetical protein